MSQRDFIPPARAGFLGSGLSEKRFTRSILAILTLVFLLPSVLFAQVTTATLSGTVQDTGGAVIPNADILVQNVLNGDKRTGKSDGAGVFTFASLPSGDYQVTITAD